jgi:hypothetical protein
VHEHRDQPSARHIDERPAAIRRQAAAIGIRWPDRAERESRVCDARAGTRQGVTMVSDYLKDPFHAPITVAEVADVVDNLKTVLFIAPPSIYDNLDAQITTISDLLQQLRAGSRSNTLTSMDEFKQTGISLGHTCEQYATG